MTLSNRRIHVEPHIKESNYIRDLVFGFGDGVNTSLGIVAGVGGTLITADIVILAALVGMFTGAKAMAVQNYLAVKSQRQILESEIKREEVEIENVPDEERHEIEEIYKSKGFEGEELKKVVGKITSNKFCVSIYFSNSLWTLCWDIRNGSKSNSSKICFFRIAWNCIWIV
jgi:vacuolar iron transporter family protein